jgi:hypothetical protein|tara:strand:+ start:249 stop:920 length:672 start_codon:yes stop_codon:yes gene_type:complete
VLDLFAYTEQKRKKLLKEGTMDISSFSKDNVDGLRILGDLPDAAFKKITQLTFGVLSDEKKQDSSASMKLLTSANIVGENMASAKIAFSGLLALLLEAAKVDAPPEQVQSVAEEAGIDMTRAELIGKGHEAHVEAIRDRLIYSSIGAGKIVDCDWRLDYTAVSSNVQTQNKGLYFVTLKVQEPNEGVDKVRDVTFSATPQQLQKLLETVRDATKQVERILKEQ